MRNAELLFLPVAVSLAACGSVAGGGPVDAGSTDDGRVSLPGRPDALPGVQPGTDAGPGVSVLTTQVQLPPTQLVSDGATLFWTTTGSPGLLGMPVLGGAIKVLLDGPVGIQGDSRFGPSYFLAVDALNVYVTAGDGLMRIPKNGEASTLVNEPGASVSAATVLGTTAYWLDTTGPQMPTKAFAVKSAPLVGGPVATVATFNFVGDFPSYMAVTSETVFFGYQVESLFAFPRSGVPDAGPPTVETGSGCEFLTSDVYGLYCAQQSGSNLRIANDGTATTLGPAISSSTVVFDENYAYWCDEQPGGAITRAPKAGGGIAAVIASDTSAPTAIAVDSTSVYWSDTGGAIKSVPK